MNTPEFEKDNLFCAFLDILGFSASVKKVKSNPGQQLGMFTTLVREAVRERPSIRGYYLSDSAVLTANLTGTKQLVDALLLMQGQSFAKGVMVRGGVSFGEVNSDDRDYVTENCWGRGLWGKAVVEAVELEKKLKGMRIALSPQASRYLINFNEKLVVNHGEGPEIRWVNTAYEEEYMEHLGELVFRCLDDDPQNVAHYVDTMRLIVRSTTQINVLATGLGVFVHEPVLPEEVAALWTDVFYRSWELFKKSPSDEDLKKLVTHKGLVKSLLNSCIGSDWIKQIRNTHPELLGLIRAVSQ